MNKLLAQADHLLTVTYPTIKDSKLLIGVLQLLGKFYEEEVTRQLRKQGIRPLQSRKALYEQLQHPGQLLITPQLQKAIQQVWELLAAYEKSPVAFRYQKQFIICDDGYKTYKIHETTVREALAKAKKLDAVNTK